MGGIKGKIIREYLAAQCSRAVVGLKVLLQGSDDTDQPSVIPLEQLKPTQMTVGMRQVALKQERLLKLARRPTELTEFILERPIRLVLGPGTKAYVIDHHHLALALIRENYETAPVQVAADYSTLSVVDFWQKMQDMKYVHPYDAEGKERPLNEIPETLNELQDDPYRSLAGFARNANAFKKVKTPFAEFQWADYFRTRISRQLVAEDFDKAIKLAVDLARHPDAKGLPGYSLDVQTSLKKGKHKGH